MERGYILSIDQSTQGTKVLLFDGRAYEGCLQKTNTDAVKHNPNLYLKHNYYALLDKGGNTMGPIFRCSHVTRVKEVG